MKSISSTYNIFLTNHQQFFNLIKCDKMLQQKLDILKFKKLNSKIKHNEKSGNATFLRT